MGRYDDPQKMFPKKWAATRKKILKRDGHRCMFEDNKGRCRHKKRLQMHHIIPKKEAPLLIWSERNLITLCVKHHKIVTGNEADYVVSFTKILGKQKKKE